MEGKKQRNVIGWKEGGGQMKADSRAKKRAFGKKADRSRTRTCLA